MANQWRKLMYCKWAVLLAVVQSSVAASQTSLLQLKIRGIAAQARGTVAVACSLPGNYSQLRSQCRCEAADAICVQVALGSGRLA